MFKTVNLELFHPTCDDAMRQLKSEMLKAKKGDCLVFVHGYGSTGKGGEIRLMIRKHLTALKNNGRIQNLFYGEDLSLNTGKKFNYNAILFKNKFPELKQYTYQNNKGVTIVEI